MVEVGVACVYFQPQDSPRVMGIAQRLIKFPETRRNRRAISESAVALSM